ncbi:hypothetical protein H2O14_10010 [Rhizobium sp. G21]|nr:hypothetical protein [Rhizobium sp. G21]
MTNASGSYWTIDGRSGDDLIIGSSRSVEYTYLNGGAGNDTLIGGAGNENFDGGAGSDVIKSNGGIDTLSLKSGGQT